MNTAARRAPEFEGIDGWMNSEALSLQGLRGKVVFLDSWTCGCANCQRTLPSMRELHSKYFKDDLVVIVMHTPEFPPERRRGNAERAVAYAGLVYPIALDSDSTTCRIYGNHYWPRQSLVDAEGSIRYEHVGESDHEEIETKVIALLREAGQLVRRESGKSIGEPG